MAVVESTRQARDVDCNMLKESISIEVIVQTILSLMLWSCDAITGNVLTEYGTNAISTVRSIAYSQRRIIIELLAVRPSHKDAQSDFHFGAAM